MTLGRYKLSYLVTCIVATTQGKSRCVGHPTRSLLGRHCHTPAPPKSAKSYCLGHLNLTRNLREIYRADPIPGESANPESLPTDNGVAARHGCSTRCPVRLTAAPLWDECSSKRPRANMRVRKFTKSEQVAGERQELPDSSKPA